MVVSVVFNHKLGGKEYHYLLDNYECKPMDDVLVPVGEYGHIEVATVVAMWSPSVNCRYSSFSLNEMKRVIAPADRDELTRMEEEEIKQIKERYDKLLSKIK